MGQALVDRAHDTASLVALGRKGMMDSSAGNAQSGACPARPLKRSTGLRSFPAFVPFSLPGQSQVFPAVRQSGGFTKITVTAPCSSVWLLVLAGAFLSFIFAANTYAQEPIAPEKAQTLVNNGRQVVAFYLDDQYRPVARVDRLKPMSEGVRAILAMYALQLGGGCGGFEEGQNLHCVLTDSLGLGLQCSAEHIHLVSTWFKNGMPNFEGAGQGAFQKALKDSDFRSLCYLEPDTSRVQQIWTIIRVRKEYNEVIVDAIGDFIVGPDSPYREIEYVTAYLINAKGISVLSNKIKSIKIKGDQS